jgi:hypothetical protein
LENDEETQPHSLSDRAGIHCSRSANNNHNSNGININSGGGGGAAAVFSVGSNDDSNNNNNNEDGGLCLLHPPIDERQMQREWVQEMMKVRESVVDKNKEEEKPMINTWNGDILSNTVQHLTDSNETSHMSTKRNKMSCCVIL